MKTDQNRRKFLSEYQPPEFTINATRLVFEINENATRVSSRLQISRQTDDLDAALRLDGIGLKLLEINIDGKSLLSERYRLSEQQLTIFDVPDEFELCCEVEI